MDSARELHRHVDKYGMPVRPRREGADTECSNDWKPFAARSDIVDILEKPQNYSKALKNLKEVLRKKIVTLGHDHPETCDTRNVITYLYLKQAKYDEAFVLHYQIKSAVIDRSYLILELYHEGEYRKALNFTLVIYEQIILISNPRNPLAIKFKMMSANIYFAMNMYKEALKAYEDIFYILFHHVEPDDPGALAMQRRIGFVLYERGKFDEALEIFQDIVNKRLTQLGSEHEDTLTSRKDLARTLVAIGKYNTGLDICKSVYEIQKNVRPKHPALWDTKCEIARILRTRGKYSEALDVLGEVCELQKANDLCSEVRAALYLAADLLSDNGNHHEAMKIYMKIYQSDKENLRNTDVVERHVALVLYKSQEFDDAKEISEIMYCKFRETFGTQHTKTLEMKTNLAMIRLSTNELDESLELLQGIYEIQDRKDFLGPNHPETLKTRMRIARVYTLQKKYQDAVGIYLQVLEIRLLTLNADHPEILQIKFNIADVYRSQDRFNESFQLYFEIHETRTRVLGPKHPDTLAAAKAMEIVSKEFIAPRLLAAVRENDLNAVEYSIENGDDINVRDIDGSVALHIASENGFVKIVKCLLMRGAIYNMKNKEGKTPMNVAKDEAVKNVFELLEELFKAVKDVKFKEVASIIEREKTIMNAKDKAGCTPLHWAASAGCNKTVSLFLDKGADFTSISKNGNTALHLAVARGYKDTVKILLQYVNEHWPSELKAFIDAKTAVLGRTCLHIVSQTNNFEILELLLKYGADTGIKNKFGKLPYEIAINNAVRVTLVTRSVADLRF